MGRVRPSMRRINIGTLAIRSKKIFYPDNVSQSVANVNTEYYSLAETQPQLQKFIDRNKDNNLIKQKMANPLRSAFEYDAVRFYMTLIIPT